MSKKAKILLPIIAFIFLGASSYAPPKNIIKHEITLIHKGVSDTEPITQTVFEVISKTKPNYFYTNVQSVICGSKVCKVVPIKLFWNKLGKYTYYELEPGIDLEKEEGVLFDKKDYEKLHDILNDINSPLKNYYKEELVRKSNHNAADALSGATINIDKNAVVEGAIWTCYTLWHWANGELVSKIKNITAEKTSTKLLQQQLTYGDIPHRIYAIEQLQARKAYDSVTLKKVQTAAKINPKLNKPALVYFENSSTDSYYKYLSILFDNADKASRITFLNSLSNIKLKAPKDFYNQFSSKLSDNDSYQEINLILNIMERLNPDSTVVAKQAEALLEHKNFLIARRAFWHLQNQKTSSPKQKSKIKLFQKKHKNSL